MVSPVARGQADELGWPVVASYLRCAIAIPRFQVVHATVQWQPRCYVTHPLGLAVDHAYHDALQIAQDQLAHYAGLFGGVHADLDADLYAIDGARRTNLPELKLGACSI